MSPDLKAFAGRTAIIGSGIAGLVAALKLAPRPVVLVTRAGLGDESSSAWAQGGIAAGIGEGDSVQSHLADTLAAGDGLCDAEAAGCILSRAGEAIALLEHHGVRFDRDGDGGYAFGLEAAHSRRRILHASADGSGAAIVGALTDAVRRCPSASVLSGVELRRILTDGEGVCGLLLGKGTQTDVLHTRQAVLATGGIGGLYEASTNPAGNFGFATLLAAKAGAKLADMEFVQFHPTALDGPRRPLALVSEAVRGEGAVIVNAQGQRFLAQIPGAELAPRDVLARAIHAEIARGGSVFLDARAALGERFSTRFPGIDRLCRQAGIDPVRQPIPVRPAAHYHMGGIMTDTRGRTNVPGLWAAGECASTGLNGANRLASNSLLEAVVMAMAAAGDIAGRNVPAPACVSAAALAPAPAPDATAVRAIVSRHLGVVRSSEGLRTAVATLLPLAESSSAAAEPAALALSLAVFALLRRESRGAHARSDFPHKDDVAERCAMTLDEVFAIARETAAAPALARSA